MNIFAVDLDPIVSARSLVDRHVVKMILESVQLLSVAHAIHGPVPEGVWDSLGWRHHPCAKWTAASLTNYRWLLAHANGLCVEYRHRYGRTHKLETDGMLARLAEVLPPLPDIGQTPFAEATGDVHEGESIVTYRRYYLEYKNHLMVWTRREPPDWVAEAMFVSQQGEKWFAKRRQNEQMNGRKDEKRR
jgi:hypothetical protein